MRGSLASLILSLESERAKLTSAIFGRTQQGLLAKFDRDSCSWKTCQASFLTDSQQLSSENFPRWGMTVNGGLYQLPTPELAIAEQDGGVYLNCPTPLTADANKHSPSANGGNNGENLVRFALGLYVPTPTASSGGYNKPSLEMMARKNLFPTPTATDYKGAPGGGKFEKEGGKKQKGSEAAGGAGKTRGYWSVEPNVGRVANGVASKVDKLKALGNGQVPIQAALAWRLLMKKQP